MNDNKSIQVFISYSTKEKTFAFRIYNDLKRSGVNTFIYEKDGKLWDDFQEEIIKVIFSSDIFLLIDSISSRKSEWVKMECKYACQFKSDKNSSLDKLLICFLDHPNELNKTEENFLAQNNINGIDFSGIDRLDYIEKYNHSIRKLCNNIDNDIYYVNWANIPEERDLIKELASSKINIEEDVSSFIKSDYKNFLFAFYSNSDTACQRIVNLINDCEKLDIRILVCIIAYGSILFNKGEYKKANEIFKKAVKHFSNDARSWSVYASSLFYIKNKSEALSAFNKSLQIIEANTKNQYYQANYYEILFKKLKVLLDLNQIKNAQDILKKLNNEKLSAEYLLAIIHISLIKKEFCSTNEAYIQLINAFYNQDVNPEYLNNYIAELEYKIGYYFHIYSTLEEALHHYLLAHQFSPQKIAYIAIITQILFSKNNDKWKVLLKKGLNLAPQVDEEEENYYYGLIKYINKEILDAEKYYNKSKKLNWPYYNNLF